MSEGQDPRRLPGGGAAPVPPAPVQVQWPQTVAVIFNPSSGGDSARERGGRIRQAIQATGKQLIWLETTREDSGQGLAKDAVGQGADLVIATGGDGTVMACATALAGSEVPLAVLPLGTGNLVAANFDIPTDLTRLSRSPWPAGAAASTWARSATVASWPQPGWALTRPCCATPTIR